VPAVRASRAKGHLCRTHLRYHKQQTSQKVHMPVQPNCAVPSAAAVLGCARQTIAPAKPKPNHAVAPVFCDLKGVLTFAEVLCEAGSSQTSGPCSPALPSVS
jgi:hypothetical protein